VGAASGTGTEEENRISYEELGRYGIDISDYADMMYQVSEEQSKSSSKSKKQKRKAAYEVVDRTRDDPEDSDDLEFGDDGEVGNDWCTYLILSHDKRKTYLGVTANLTRRLRQHNGELAGGAKSVRGGRPWSLVWTVRGFGTRSEACQFEWRLRNFAKGYLDVDEALFKEIPSNYQDSHVILRRWAAFKKVHETMDDWKHMRVEWH
jgi:structure-specific endonuclease subunit SLX1